MTEVKNSGADKGTVFMALLGTCITEWAWIEEQVYEICQLILGTEPEHTSILFYRTPTLESRIALADELMGTIFPKPESGEHSDPDAAVWRKLLLDIRAEMPVRNQLAHSPATAGVYGTMDEKTGVITKVVTVAMHSVPHPHETWRPKTKNKAALHEPDLQKHLEAVRSLHERLKTFGRELLPKHVRSAFPDKFGK